MLAYPHLASAPSLRFPETIQLVEVSPPPKPSVLSSDHNWSTDSSHSWAYSTSYSSSHSTSSGGASPDDDEDAGNCESYCSSENNDDDVDNSVVYDDDNELSFEDHSSKMSRVLAWRNSFDSVYGSDAEVFQSLKQKYGHARRDTTDQRDGTVCCGARTSSLFICSACDTSFSTMQQLKLHASQEACRVAVQYGFES